MSKIAKPTEGEQANAWVARDITYEDGTALPRAVTSDHPLLDHLKASDGPIISVAGDDAAPVAGAGAPTEAPVEELDPLSAMLLAESSAPPPSTPEPKAPSFSHATQLHTDEAWEESRHIANQWTVKKQAILKDFTVSGKVSVTSSFLSGSETPTAPVARNVALETSRARLEQLERVGAVDDSVEITHQEYLDLIHKLQHNLFAAWMKSARVESLRITIRCAKLLSHIAVPTFYPTMFCYITGILDTFGQLVFERIRVRAEEVDSRLGGGRPLPEDFTCHDIGDEAKETCKNWIYKTACIRELVPRLYVEIAMLKCYRFVTEEKDLPAIVERISHMIRGIADPVIAAYARTYLSLMASQVIHGARNREAVTSGLHDLMFCFKDAVSDKRASWLHEAGISQPVYLSLMSPAVDWLTWMASVGASKQEFLTVMAAYKDHCGNSMVLKSILSNFDSSFYSPHTKSVADLCRTATPSLVTLAELYCAMAEGLTASPPPESKKMGFLQDSWRVITKVENPVLYAKCAATFTGLLVVAYSERELLIVLKDLVTHMKRAAAAPAGAGAAGTATASADTSAAGRLPEAVLPHVESVLTQLAGRAGEDIGSIVTSDSFIALLDMFHGDRKVMFCKSLLKTFVENADTTNDPVLIHTLFDVATTLHDSLDNLSADDERRQVADLICRFMSKIDFGRDVQQHLNTLVEFRAAFSNLDSVKDRLILEVLKLAMKTLRIVRGRHNKKTTAFVKGCFAFVHITVPSIDDVFTRLLLFKLAGEVALSNQCLPQADTFFKACIQEIPDIPEFEGTAHTPTEGRLADFLRGFLSSIILVPGHPQQGPFYLVKGLQNAMGRYPWSAGSLHRGRVLVALLPVLAAFAQVSLPYHVDRVDSNDVLYAGDPDYTSELVALMNEVMNDILLHLADFTKDGSMSAAATQTTLVVELLSQIVAIMQLNDKTTSLTLKLFQLARKHAADSPALVSLSAVVKERSATVEHLRPLAAALTDL